MRPGLVAAGGTEFELDDGAERPAGVPAYPSGHATFGAVALQVTLLFYGLDGKAVRRDSELAELATVSDE